MANVLPNLIKYFLLKCEVDMEICFFTDFGTKNNLLSHIWMEHARRSCAISNLLALVFQFDYYSVRQIK